MSNLKKEDLMKLSLKQLEKFSKGVDGEDLVLVNECIEAKKLKAEETAANGSGNEANDLAKSSLAAAKAEAAEKLAALKAEKEALHLSQVAEAKALKEKKAAERLEAMKDAEQAKVLRAQDRAKRVAERLEKVSSLREQREKDRIAKLEARLEAIRNGVPANVDGVKENKTDIIKKLLMEGLSNREIADRTGYGNKFICDTVWRIARSIEAQTGKLFVRPEKPVATETSEEVAETQEEVAETKNDVDRQIEEAMEN